jgi:hypothetical protein
MLNEECKEIKIFGLKRLHMKKTGNAESFDQDGGLGRNDSNWYFCMSCHPCHQQVELHHFLMIEASFLV